jgi:hypothetical protein
MSEKKEDIKKELDKELYLRNAIEVEGLKFDPAIFKDVLEDNQWLITYHPCMDFSTDDTTNIKIPASVRFEHGIGVDVRKNRNSPYSFEKFEDGIYIVKEGERLTKIYFNKTPDYYNKKTSSGVSMRTICQSGNLDFDEGVVFVAYSEECSLIDKGHDCLFCNINATKARFSELEGHQWKYPKQIGETVKAAFDEGYDHFNITGGFVPERRELEYYLDVAEAIQNETGLIDFNGTAVIGAPTDLNVLEQYKQAGYRTVAIHPEVWGKDFFNAICPGKAETGGGYENYIRAIDYAIEVFGKGRVRTQFVAGLQPKEYVIDGLEILAEKGAIPLSLPWIPNIGSALEGHRTPTPEWHWDLQKKNYDILKKNGITYEQLYDVLPGTRLIQDFYRVDAGYYPKYPKNVSK